MIVIVSPQIVTMKSVYTADPFSTHTIGFVSALTSIWDFDLLMAAVKVQSLTFEASCEEQGDPWPVFRNNFLKKKNTLITSNSAISYHKHDRPVTFCLGFHETTI